MGDKIQKADIVRFSALAELLKLAVHVVTEKRGGKVQDSVGLTDPLNRACGTVELSMFAACSANFFFFVA